MAVDFETLGDIVVSAIVVVGALALAVWAYYRRQGSNSSCPKTSWKDELTASTKSKTIAAATAAVPSRDASKTTAASRVPITTSNTTTNDKNDVWAHRRTRGIAAASSHGSKEDKQGAHQQEQPFGSSYYYAHNNSSAKGGYADGLTMEDFTMNGPRLLSSSSSSVKNENSTLNEKEDSTAPSDVAVPVTTKSAAAAAVLTQPKRRVLNITKYLLDDPDDGLSPATIRIDELPSATAGAAATTTTTAWKDVTIKNIQADLTAEKGLLVLVETEKNDADDCDYQLHLRQLPVKWSVGSVKTVLKTSKRLLVKLYPQKK